MLNNAGAYCGTFVELYTNLLVSFIIEYKDVSYTISWNSLIKPFRNSQEKIWNQFTEVYEKSNIDSHEVE